MTEHDVHTLSWWIDLRRARLGLTVVELAERAGMSKETIKRAGGGRPMREANKRKLEDALLWQPGSIDRIAAGGEPVDIDVTPVRRADGSVDAVAAVRALLSLAASLREGGNDADAEETLEMATRLARRHGVLAQLADEITAAGM